MSASREKKLRKQEKETAVPQKQKVRVDKILIRLGITVVCLVLVVLILIGMGVPHKMFNAISANGMSLTVADYNYAYGVEQRTASQYGEYYEMFTGNKSVAEATEKTLYNQLLICAEAEKNGLKLSDSDKAIVADQIADFEQALKDNNLKETKYFKDNYGRGVNIDQMVAYQERQLLMQQFAEDFEKKNPSTDADIQKKYDDNKADYDTVSYMMYTISGTKKTYSEGADDTKKKTESDAEKTAMQKQGDELAAKATSDDAFAEAVKALKTEEEQKTFDKETLYTRDTMKSSATSTEGAADWLFGTDIKAGDVKVFVAQTDTSATDGVTFNATVIRFIDRKQQTGNSSATIRTIQVDADIDAGADKPTDEQLKAAEEKAKKLQADYQAGAKTPEAFAELAKQSSDINGRHTGGLLEDRGLDADSDDEGVKWYSDPARKQGDTTIVPLTGQDNDGNEITTGYSLVYFESIDTTPLWKTLVENTLLTDKNDAFMKELEEKNPLKTNLFPGSLFVTKSK